VSFVGKEVLVYGTGCHLIFVNLSTTEELIYTANNARTGDGIQCFVGHRTQSIFAFAEKRTNPTVFVKTYPNFEEISSLKDNAPRGYVNIVFSETSLMVTLGDLPDFTLTVWNWRKNEKIASQDTNIRLCDQLLKYDN
jgi:hypothetical protein